VEQFGGSPNTEHQRVLAAILQAGGRAESNEEKSATEKEDGCECERFVRTTFPAN